jgi:hypothetical protein
MHQYLLKNLFLSSLLTLVFISCSPTAGYKLQGKARITDAEILPLIPKTGSLLFKAKIDLYSKHYSGLIILKQTDSLIAHLTFVTEVGMKMFDFEIQNHKLKAVYIFEPLNKPKLIKLLTSDLELLILQKAYNKEASVYNDSEKITYLLKENMKYYYFVNSNHSIHKSLVKGTLFKKLKITYSYSNTQKLDQLFLKHSGFFPLKIRLIALSGENQ